MNDQQLTRYSRHILLSQIDSSGQTKIINAKILLIGLGGLGSAASIYLASSGIGKLVIVDDDVVDLSNLSRQILYSIENLGQLKTVVAQQRLQQFNPDIIIDSQSQRLNKNQLIEQINQVDLVLDATDNFTARQLINQVCVQLAKPLVSASCLAMSGQIAVFANNHVTAPCYACLYADLPSATEELPLTCAESGIISPLAGVMGSMQALEALKIILGYYNAEQPAKLLCYKADQANWREILINQDPHCKICGT